MKKLSDYKGEDALELWDRLLDPLSAIIGNPEIKAIVRSGKNKLEIARALLRVQRKEIVEILLMIDPEPIDGLNIVSRLISLLSEIGQNDEVKAFFGYAAQVKQDSVSSDSHMENIEGAEN